MRLVDFNIDNGEKQIKQGATWAFLVPTIFTERLGYLRPRLQVVK